MKKSHRPSETTPARTTFGLTDDEVTQACFDYVSKHEQKVPDGKMSVYVRDRHDDDIAEPLVKLIIEHTEVPQ